MKKFILNQNNLNNKENKKMQNKEVNTNNEENNKKNTNNSWKGLNISSHYLGNTFNNQFGITTNRFYVSKDFMLTNSRENTKHKNDYTTNSLLLSNNKKDLRLKFINLNMPNKFSSDSIYGNLK